jgi:hypothetical protein
MPIQTPAHAPPSQLMIAVPQHCPFIVSPLEPSDMILMSAAIKMTATCVDEFRLHKEIGPELVYTFASEDRSACESVVQREWTNLFDVSADISGSIESIERLDTPTLRGARSGGRSGH